MTPAPDDPVYITRPICPPRAVLDEHLSDVLRSACFTNKGPKHQLLEERLAAHLRAPHLSLTSSGTTALVLALRALRCTGEVITTPLTFQATVNAILWAGCEPVFADVDPETMCVDPAEVEALVTPRTSAILGVHAFGTPCRVGALQSVADKHGLRVIYDAAHAFGVEVEGRPISDFGDASAFSFHATKLFHCAEGGAVASPDPRVKARVDILRNHGIESEGVASMCGLNGKMSEVHAALGLCVIDLVDEERKLRLEVDRAYRAEMANAPGISCPPAIPGVRPSLQYFPVRVPSYGMLGHENRDALRARLRRHGVHARAYFSPIVSGCGQDVPEARRIADEVLCLPYYGYLGAEGARRIGRLVAAFQRGESR